MWHRPGLAANGELGEGSSREERGQEERGEIGGSKGQGVDTGQGEG